MKGSAPQKEEKKAAAKVKAPPKEASAAVKKDKEEAKTPKAGAVVVSKFKHKCPVPHPYQDTQYSGGRVVNVSKKGTGLRCTVCGDDVQ